MFKFSIEVEVERPSVGRRSGESRKEKEIEKKVKKKEEKTTKIENVSKLEVRKECQTLVLILGKKAGKR